MDNEMQKAVIDADFYIKLTKYASDNGKLFCQVMGDLGVHPIMHKYVAEVELRVCTELKDFITQGKIEIEQNRCAMACQGCGIVIFCFL